MLIAFTDFFKKEKYMLYFLIYLVIMNVLTIIMFRIDKYKAVKDKWRIKESTLHLLSFLGGSPGALWAEKKFHHKNAKKSFYLVTYLAILVDIFLLGIIIYFVYFR